MVKSCKNFKFIDFYKIAKFNPSNIIYLIENSRILHSRGTNNVTLDPNLFSSYPPYIDNKMFQTSSRTLISVLLKWRIKIDPFTILCLVI